MPTAGSGRPDDRDSLMSVRDHGIFQGMRVFFATVIMFLFAGVLRPATGPLGGINDNFLFFISIFLVVPAGFEVAMR